MGEGGSALLLCNALEHPLASRLCASMWALATPPRVLIVFDSPGHDLRVLARWAKVALEVASALDAVPA